MEYQVREEINEEIFAEISKLWNETGVGSPLRGDSLASIKNTLKFDGKILSLYDNNKLIGTCWVTCDGRRLFLHHMAISPAYQNKGCGNILLQHVVAYGHEKHLQIKLEVNAENKIAQHLYTKNGFEQLNNYYVMIKRKV